MADRRSHGVIPSRRGNKHTRAHHRLLQDRTQHLHRLVVAFHWCCPLVRDGRPLVGPLLHCHPLQAGWLHVLHHARKQPAHLPSTNPDGFHQRRRHDARSEAMSGRVLGRGSPVPIPTVPAIPLTPHHVRDKIATVALLVSLVLAPERSAQHHASRPLCDRPTSLATRHARIPPSQTACGQRRPQGGSSHPAGVCLRSSER
jgi:hypothetical protein